MAGDALLMVILGVRLDVLFSYWGNDMYSSAQTAVQAIGGDEAVRKSGIDGFWTSWIVFGTLATLHVVRIMTDLWLTQRFMLRWRNWLTDRLTGDWLDGHAYYRSRFIADTIDNPDQRIQTDIDIFTAGVDSQPNTPNNYTKATLLFGAVDAVVSVTAFASILWGLSREHEHVRDTRAAGDVLRRAALGVRRHHHRVLDRPPDHPARLRQREVQRRLPLRAGAIAGRGRSGGVLPGRGGRTPAVGPAVRAGRAQLPALHQPDDEVQRLESVDQPGHRAGALAVSGAGRLFDGQIKLGDVTQASSAFSSIQDGLSFFRNQYDSFAGWRASIIRLYGLVVANDEGRDLPKLDVTDSRDCLVELDDVEVRTPDGKQLINPLDLRLHQGDTLIVTGRSGSGKTTLLRSLAQLWPYTSGTFRCPDGPDQTMFLSQMPYVPLGDLRAVVSYPSEPGEIPDDELIAMLNKVALPSCAKRLSEVEDWAKVLSPGEQQRIAFARILLTKPKVVFMDEATSALDEGLEYMLYDMVRTELPDTIIVSVTHRNTVDQHHEQELELLGGGEWRLGLSGGDEPAPTARVPVSGDLAVETFTPSLDWSNEAVHSLLWVARAWLLAAVPLMLALFLIAALHPMGPGVLGDHRRVFQGPSRAFRRGGCLGCCWSSVMVSVRLSVVLTYYNNDQYSALQVAFEGSGAGNEAVKNSGIRGFWFSIVVFLVLLVVYISQILLDIYLTQRFIVRWRVWLTERFIGDWLTDKAYYRARFLGERIDNPDQRIQQDIDAFTAGTGQGPNSPLNGTTQTLLFGSVNAIVSVLSFGPILWNLSGSLTLFGVTIPKALFWLVLVYVLVISLGAFRLGHPLIRLSFRNELTNAAFRYGLVRLRDVGESVAFSRGEPAEGRSLVKRLSDVISNYRAYVRRSIVLYGWNQTFGLVTDPLPMIVQAPRLFANQLDLGDVTQSTERIPQSVQLALVLPQRLRLLRDVPGHHHPVARTRRRQQAGPEADIADRAAQRRRRGATRRRGGSGSLGQAVDRPARSSAGARGLADDRRALGMRQVHPVAQPGADVALHHRDPVLPAGLPGHDVPASGALHAAGQPACRAVLSRRLLR